MSLRREVKKLIDFSACLARQPLRTLKLLGRLPQVVRGFEYAQRWEARPANGAAPANRPQPAASNPLREFFDARESGRGIWKCLHYFDVYHRHLARFVGREVNIVEIGVYSGGSLEMWRHYFGPGCRVFGVDVQAACKSYENEFTEIFIGDQADRGFWRTFKERVPRVDILVDDAGHRAEDQIVTLEEMLGHLQPGGTYLCEDVHRVHNRFASFVSGLVQNLHDTAGKSGESVRPSSFQSCIHSVHVYPFMTVIEKNAAPVDRFIASKHGSQWQPFSTHGLGTNPASPTIAP